MNFGLSLQCSQLFHLPKLLITYKPKKDLSLTILFDLQYALSVLVLLRQLSFLLILVRKFFFHSISFNIFASLNLSALY